MQSIFDAVLIVESIFSPGETFILHADGSASFAFGDHQFNSDGTASLNNGGVTFGFYSGYGSLFTYGPCSLSNGGVIIDAYGDLTVASAFNTDGGYIFTDGGGNLTVNGSTAFANGAVTIDSFGDVALSNGSFSVGGGGATSLDGGLIYTDGGGNLYIGSNQIYSPDNGDLYVEAAITSAGGNAWVGIDDRTYGHDAFLGFYSDQAAGCLFSGYLLLTAGVGNWNTFQSSQINANCIIGLTPYGNDPSTNPQLLTVLGSISTDNGAITTDGNGDLTIGGSASFNAGATVIEYTNNFSDYGISTNVISIGGFAPFYGNTTFLADGSASFAGDNVHIDTSGNLTSGTVTLTPAGAPGSPSEGQMYFDSTSKHFYGYNGTEWVTLG